MALEALKGAFTMTMGLFIEGYPCLTTLLVRNRVGCL